MRNIPEQKQFQSLMWQEMSDDPEWSESMDNAITDLPPGQAWPVEN